MEHKCTRTINLTEIGERIRARSFRRMGIALPKLLFDITPDTAEEYEVLCNCGVTTIYLSKSGQRSDLICSFCKAKL